MVPLLARAGRRRTMLAGLGLQVAALVLFVLIPRGSMGAAALSVVLYAAGFSVFKPFLDSSLAEVTEGRSRAGIHALNNALICLAGAAAAAVSGYLHHVNPGAAWLASSVLLVGCAVAVANLRGPAFDQTPDLAPAMAPTAPDQAASDQAASD